MESHNKSWNVKEPVKSDRIERQGRKAESLLVSQHARESKKIRPVYEEKVGVIRDL